MKISRELLSRMAKLREGELTHFRDSDGTRFKAVGKANYVVIEEAKENAENIQTIVGSASSST